MVQRWCSEADELLLYRNSDITRKPGAGMRPMYEKIDQKLADFFKFCIDNGIHVTSHMLKTKALELHKMEDGGSSDFKASGGWLRGFMRRNGISFKEQSINSALIMTGGEESGVLETSDDQSGHIIYGSDPSEQGTYLLKHALSLWCLHIILRTHALVNKITTLL